MMKTIFLLLLLLCGNAFAALTDIKFGRYQIADSQWNVSACTTTSTCQIYSKNPGTAYKIPWTSGQIQWAAGDYIQFQSNEHKDANNPWLAVQYGSNGVAKTNMGTGHIVNMGSDYFFFVGNDNDTGQLFSGSSGMANTSGVTWTGTLNPTMAQANSYASNYSTEPLTAGQTAAPAAPSLCCGGQSGVAISPDTQWTTRRNTFVNRTTNNTQVYIEQIGNGNTISVNQSGTRNNAVRYEGNGSNNNVSINQTGNASTMVNYTELAITGNGNNANITQQSTGGYKGAYVKIQDNNNSVLLQQKDSGNHYAEITLTGGQKNVDVLQQGSGNHSTKIGLTGMPVDLSLSQSGSSPQTYAIQFNCATAGGCAKITVVQGQ